MNHTCRLLLLSVLPNMFHKPNDTLWSFRFCLLLGMLFTYTLKSPAMKASPKPVSCLAITLRKNRVWNIRNVAWSVDFPTDSSPASRETSAIRSSPSRSFCSMRYLSVTNDRRVMNNVKIRLLQILQAVVQSLSGHLLNWLELKATTGYGQLSFVDHINVLNDWSSPLTFDF